MLTDMEVNPLTKDRINGVIILLTGIIWMLLTTQVKGNAFSTVIGPELFPNLASGGLILCGIGLIFRKREEDKESFFSQEGWKRVAKLSITLIVYPFVLDYLGFIVASLFLLLVTTTLFDLDKTLPLRKRIFFSIIIATLAYLFFQYVLDLPLPIGRIIRLILG